ncbi:hypothetical protein DFH06DRAFT_1468697 [Mycena polygramma]|nr:hypothetical protein DFH06DRAFT_1468697 [Mycena polygramma]
MTCWHCGADPGDRDATARFSCPAIDHLLRSNDPPLDAETPVLTYFAENGRRRMNSLDERIHNLKVTLDGLILERHDLARRVQQCATVLSPIRRVPPEIVGEIFSWTLPRTTRVAGHPPSRAPWYLGQISGIWREIALGLPSLWSSITVFHTDDSPRQDFPPLPMVQAQLLRSANAHLHVDFEWMIDEECASPFMDALLAHSNRWRSLRLCGDSNALLELMHAAKGRLAQLHTLEIDDDAREDDDSVVSDIFSIAPNLRQVVLTTATFSCFSPPLSIPWAQITQYRGVATFEQLTDILPEASGLVDCALGFADDGQEMTDGTVITLPRLRRLFTERGEFLACLTAPQLEYLSTDTVWPVLPFIQRSLCRLTTLVLADASTWLELPLEAAIHFSQHTPALENLVLQGSTLAEEDNRRVLSALMVTGSSSDLCPNLTFFAYGALTSAPLSLDALTAMIRSRRQPNRVCQLSSLRVFSCASSDVENLLANMQTLIDGGLDVKVLESQSVEQARYCFVVPQ